jgi:hypothetical protein
MMQAGDLDSQGEKLYRIRALSLTPEFTAPRRHASVASLFTKQYGSPERFRYARACMICGSSGCLPGM